MPSTSSLLRSNWDPFREMNELQNRMDSIFSRRFGNGDLLETMAESDWAPAVDIIEEDECFKIEADLPEVKKEDVHVSVDNGILTLPSRWGRCRPHPSQIRTCEFPASGSSWTRFAC